MNAEIVEIVTPGPTLRARLLRDRAPATAATIAARLPFDAVMQLDEWSGFVARIRPAHPFATAGTDEIVAFAYPGLVMVDPATGDLAICFGQGRLQNGFGPQPAIPVMEIGGDIEAFRPHGIRLQYDGPMRVSVRRAADQDAPLVAWRREKGRRISVELGDARAEADLLEESAPVTTASLVSKLPLAGIGTNTFLSGPLVRLRDRDGSEAELALETAEREATHTILYPGYLYYRPIRPRGLRIAARDATTMGGGVVGSGTPLVPIARLDGDWSSFRAEAAALPGRGMRPLRLALL